MNGASQPSLNWYYTVNKPFHALTKPESIKAPPVSAYTYRPSPPAPAALKPDEIPVRRHLLNSARPAGGGERDAPSLASANDGPAHGLFSTAVVTRTQLAAVGIPRTKSYELASATHRNYDPDWPVGFKLFASPRAPTVWWAADIVAWLNKKVAEHRHRLEVPDKPAMVSGRRRKPRRSAPQPMPATHTGQGSV